ncbi:MAG: phenylalanine--tRNA ligase subunit alpha, partial [Solirubrobacteraceae bacterium]
MSALDQIARIGREALQAVDGAGSSAELEQIRVRYLGRKADLPNLLRRVADLPAEQRAASGKAANEARQAITARIDQKAGELAASELQERLERDRIDVTLPADPLPAIGHLHLITQTRREIEDVFVELGFTVQEGPDVETAYYNFDALNTPVTHPSRLQSDTFYVKPADREGEPGAEASDGRQTPPDLDIFDPDTVLLRVHTSPMQIRAMEKTPPPLYVIVPGRAYRPDSDATHAPQFHQVEGLAVDTDVTLADLKGTLLRFARAIFGEDREVRLRPHFFPFTEPSVELDVSCFNCVDGVTSDGERCPLCKGTAWIELLGAGMVDPNVFEYVREHGYDPEKVQG